MTSNSPDPSGAADQSEYLPADQPADQGVEGGAVDWTAILAREKARVAKVVERDPFAPGASAHLSSIFVDDTHLPQQLMKQLGRYYSPFQTVNVPVDVLRSAADIPRGEPQVLEPNIATELQSALDKVADAHGRAVVRFGGRTPHDVGPPFISSAHEIARLLHTSERAMLEAWSWCSDRSFLPTTFHKPVEGHEWRALIDMDTAELLALSHSMWDSVYASDDEQRRPLAAACKSAQMAQEAIRSMLTEQGDSMRGMGRQWLDLKVVSGGALHVLDVNVDEPGTWMGGHEELEADPASGTTLWAEGHIWYWPSDANLTPEAAIAIKSCDADSPESD